MSTEPTGMRITFDSLLVDSDNYGVVIFHVWLWIIFGLIRIPLYQPGMIEKHFDSGTTRSIEEYTKMSPLERVGVAFYNSALVQTAWGALDLIAVSPLAKFINFVQIAISFFVTAGTINLILSKGRLPRQR